MKNKKKLILIISMFIGVIVLALASSYALFTINVTKNTDFKIVLGNLELKITDTTTEDKYILESVVPTKDSDALTQDGYTFTITNMGSIDSYYTVYLDDILLESEKERLDNNYLKLDIFNHKTNNHKTNKLSNYNEENRKIISGQLKKGESITYTLRMWVDYNIGNEAQNKYFATQIRVVGEQLNTVVYQEEILNGAKPVLTDDLVPVEINDNGIVTKADLHEEWYSYQDKRWANAIVLKDRYDENTIYDLSGNGNNATIHGATMTDEGLYFDGIDDYAKIDLLDLNQTDQITIEFEASFPNEEKLAVPFELSSNFNIEKNSFVVTINEASNNESKNNCLNFATLFTSTGYNLKRVDSVLSDTYKTYTITFNTSKSYNDFTSIYVDGVKQNAHNPNENTKSDVSGKKFSNYPFFIGGRNGEDLFSEMTLKSLKIYTKELTQEEINNNLNNNTVPDKLILMYDLNNYLDNEVIPEEAIESYFVWIPKYSYQLWDLGNYSSLTSIDSTKPHAIPIKFGLTNTSDSKTGECTTPGVAGESGNCKVGDYMTHPAFLAFDTNGMWVGKFETGYDGASSTTQAEINGNDANKVIIKPNSYSWRNNTVVNMFKASAEYMSKAMSHMMKNTEWGAVAYLSHSDYGINKEIRINNNGNYITGYSSIEPSTVGYNNGINIEGNKVETTLANTDGVYTVNYKNNQSVLSSTTGNYSGIYDMSGGAWEYVMGYTSNASTVGGSSQITTIYTDFYTNNGYQKYYDKYSSTLEFDYNNKILGDATGEFGPFFSELDPDKSGRYKSSWYHNYSFFANSSYPWFLRGGDWVGGSTAGGFAFNSHAGAPYSSMTFRIVLAPTK